MYRRQQRSLGLGSLILLGVVAGLVVLIYTQLLNQPATEPQVATPTPPQPTAVFIEQAETPTFAPTPVNAYESIQEASLFIPAAGINAPIIRVFLDGRSWNIDNLGANIGHLQGTHWLEDPGPGNIVLSGHVEMSDGRLGVFEPIKDLAPGDRVVLRHNNEEHIYSVTRIGNVQPDDLTPLYPTESDILTLITCDEYDFLSDEYQSRTIVVAERLS